MRWLLCLVVVLGFGLQLTADEPVTNAAADDADNPAVQRVLPVSITPSEVEVPPPPQPWLPPAPPEAITSFVHPLQHASAEKVAAQVSAALQNVHCLDGAKTGLVVKSPIVIVPDTALNCLVVAASTQFVDEIKEQIAKADVEPHQYRVRVRITTTDSEGQPFIVAPEITTIEGQAASVVVGDTDLREYQVDIEVADVTDSSVGALAPAAADAGEAKVLPTCTTSPRCSTIRCKDIAKVSAGACSPSQCSTGECSVGRCSIGQCSADCRELKVTDIEICRECKSPAACSETCKAAECGALTCEAADSSDCACEATEGSACACKADSSSACACKSGECETATECCANDEDSPSVESCYCESKCSTCTCPKATRSACTCPEATCSYDTCPASNCDCSAGSCCKTAATAHRPALCPAQSVATISCPHCGTCVAICATEIRPACSSASCESSNEGCECKSCQCTSCQSKACTCSACQCGQAAKPTSIKLKRSKRQHVETTGKFDGCVECATATHARDCRQSPPLHACEEPSEDHAALAELASAAPDLGGCYVVSAEKFNRHEEKIASSLNQRISLNFDKTHLKEVLRQIALTADIDIYIDDVGLNNINVTVDQPVSIRVEGISVKSALSLLLEPLSLACTIDDEVLKISTHDRLASHVGCEHRTAKPEADEVHRVGHRVFEDEVSECILLSASVQRHPVAPLTAKVYSISDLVTATDGGVPLLTPEQLVDLIQKTIHSESWEHQGGPAGVEFFETTLSLVIRQQDDTHAEISQLLTTLRELQKLKSCDVSSLGQFHHVKKPVEAEVLSAPSSFQSVR